MSVLKSFSPDELELSAADISLRVGIPKTTTHRMLNALTKGGLLDRNTETGKYRIGPELYILGILYLSTTDILKATKPVVETLNSLTSEAVNVSIFENGYVTMIMKEECKHAFKYSYNVGSVLPAYASAMGKAFLSELTEAELDSFYPEERLEPRTPKTIATKTELKLDLQQIKKTGIGFSSEDAHVGVEAVGSIIRDARGKAAAAMSISIPVFRVNQASRERLATLIRLGARLASYRLGYKDPTHPVYDIEQIRSWWEQNQTDSKADLAWMAPTRHRAEE